MINRMDRASAMMRNRRSYKRRLTEQERSEIDAQIARDIARSIDKIEEQLAGLRATVRELETLSSDAARIGEKDEPRNAMKIQTFIEDNGTGTMCPFDYLCFNDGEKLSRWNNGDYHIGISGAGEVGIGFDETLGDVTLHNPRR